MEVTLINYTPNPERAIAEAAKICYFDADKVSGKMTDEQVAKMLRMLCSSGHGTPLEHASFTFLIKGISRACSHELVRHRIASFNQRSQRYIKEDNFDYVIPPKISGTENEQVYKDMMEYIRATYNLLVESGIPKENARYILPNATETELTMTINASSLFNFFSLRCCTREQWEIRKLAKQMLDLVKEVAPVLFEKAGAFCDQNGFCKEENSCGRCDKYKPKNI